ncbi:MAG TPA: hypothetical protein VGK67_30680 [Myxococcales bacterium]|jgi:hypothetical protein
MADSTAFTKLSDDGNFVLYGAPTSDGGQLVLAVDSVSGRKTLALAALPAGVTLGESESMAMGAPQTQMLLAPRTVAQPVTLAPDQLAAIVEASRPVAPMPSTLRRALLVAGAVLALIASVAAGQVLGLVVAAQVPAITGR